MNDHYKAKQTHIIKSGILKYKGGRSIVNHLSNSAVKPSFKRLLRCAYFYCCSWKSAKLRLLHLELLQVGTH